MDIQQLLSNLQSILSLYGELLLAIAAAAVLGFVVGKMIDRSSYRKALQGITSSWELRYAALADSARNEAGALTDQLQSTVKEHKTLIANHKSLKHSLAQNDASVQQARAETIELNRQQAETHARLQKIIQQKELEIIRLSSKLSSQASTTTRAQKNGASPEPHTSGNSLGELIDGELDDSRTIAPPAEQIEMDATVQIDVDTQALLASRRGSRQTDNDAQTDEAVELGNVGLEDGTIALDDEAMAFAQRLHKKQRTDDESGPADT